MCGKDREVSGDVPVSIRALHQPSQAQHLSLLAQAADEGDEPAHDRRLSRQPLPAHESGVSHRTLPPALPGGLRGSGGVTESHRGAWGGEKRGQNWSWIYFRKGIPEAFDFRILMQCRIGTCTFILRRRSLISFVWDMFWVVGLHTFRLHSHLPFRFLPQTDKKLACINLPLVPTYLPSSEGAYFKNVWQRNPLFQYLFHNLVQKL